jgi:hypothetical protein
LDNVGCDALTDDTACGLDGCGESERTRLLGPPMLPASCHLADGESLTSTVQQGCIVLVTAKLIIHDGHAVAN